MGRRNRVETEIEGVIRRQRKGGENGGWWLGRGQDKRREIPEGRRYQRKEERLRVSKEE